MGIRKKKTQTNKQTTNKQTKMSKQKTSTKVFYLPGDDVDIT